MCFFHTSSVIILDLCRDHFYGSNLSPKPILVAFFFLCVRKMAFDLKYLPPIYLSVLYPILLVTAHPFPPPPFKIQPSQWFSVSDTNSNQYFLTSHSPSPLCLLSNCGLSVICFVCTICAGFEGSQMVVIGVVLWDCVEGKHLSMLQSQAK